MLGIRSYLKKLYRRYIYFPYKWQSTLDSWVKTLKTKNEIVIAFIVINIPMWKYQPLYDLLKKNKRFKLYVVLSPSVKYSFEERCRDVQLMRDYFSKRGMDYVDWDIEHHKDPVDIKKEIYPDILFYTQPGVRVFTKLHSFRHFHDKLLCYTFYGYITTDNKHFYDREFLNIAWKLYYPMEIQRKMAKKYAERKDANVVVSGYSEYDRFVTGPFHNVWKSNNPHVKKIIWAPHFTITKSLIEGFAPRSNFLWMADLMINIAEQYKDQLQIAFKPHPRLLTELYNHPEWGKAKADEYYKKWEDLSNGQLETGDFINLFYYSDAMIHDSDSFVIDYLYFNKPEMFITKNINIQKQEADELSGLIYDNIYVGSTKEDIIAFIEKVVLAGNDYKAKACQKIVEDYLLPPNGKLASQNMYDDLCKSLGVEC